MTVMIQIVVVHFCTFTFIQRLLKSDFSQVPPTGMHAQTRQFLTIASRTVPVRCPRSSDCQADCSTLWGRKHGSFWVDPKRTVRVREMISSPVFLCETCVN